MLFYGGGSIKIQEREELQICINPFMEFIQHICANKGLCDIRVHLGLKAGMKNHFLDDLRIV